MNRYYSIDIQNNTSQEFQVDLTLTGAGFKGGYGRSTIHRAAPKSTKISIKGDILQIPTIREDLDFRDKNINMTIFASPLSEKPVMLLECNNIIGGEVERVKYRYSFFDDVEEIDVYSLKIPDVTIILDDDKIEAVFNENSNIYTTA